MLAAFTGCFGGVETTSKKYKKELLEKVFVKNDKKAKAKYNELIAELEKVADGENEKAEKELDFWDCIRRTKSATDMIPMKGTHILLTN